MALAFVALSVAVAAGFLAWLDSSVAAWMEARWSESLHAPFQGIALLGGSELTLVVAAALAAYLYGSGFRREAWVLASLPLAIALEVLYKHLLIHPAPAGADHHEDGPSVSELLGGAVVGGNSFPSGHVMRAVLVYGLVAFVVWRLAGSRRTRTLVLMSAVVLGAVMSLDRLYLGVHWTSDVVGGLLLGGLALALAIAWLDRVPKAAA